MTKNGQMFISHAHADKELADLLRDTLVLGGVPEDRIFYSSDRQTGVPAGREVVTSLQQKLRQADLVIELLSETFLTRPMCLMEFGGAWALGLPTFPIVAPPLARDQAIREIGNVQMGVLGTDEEIGEVLNELNDLLNENLGISVKSSAWKRAAKHFNDNLPRKLALGTRAAGRDSASRGLPPKQSSVSARNSEPISFSNHSVVNTPLGNELHVEVTNNDGVVHTASLKATFYDGERRIAGTSDVVVNQLHPGVTKTATFRNVPVHQDVKVDIDTLL